MKVIQIQGKKKASFQNESNLNSSRKETKFPSLVTIIEAILKHQSDIKINKSMKKDMEKSLNGL